MPNFEDAPDGSSSINHTGEAFWNEDDYMSETFFTAGAPPSPPPVNFEITENPFLPSPPPILAANPNRRIEARTFSQGERPPPLPPPQTATQVNEARRAARINPAWESATPNACEADPPHRSVDIGPSPPRRTRSRRGLSDPDAAIRKDPNAWSMREAVELCKLLEVVVPEAGFHIALTGGLLYKEGRRKDCDLMFYQIRQVDPNYEILWKYLTVAGVIRSPSYPENGWLVKATYRGKAIDCLFPNAGKKKKGTAKDVCDKAAPVPPAPHAVGEQNTAFGAQSLASNNAGTCNMETGSVLVRHNDGAPIIYHRIPEDLAEFLATPAPAPIPPPTINAAVAAARIVESAASAFISPPAPIPAAAAEQYDIPF